MIIRTSPTLALKASREGWLLELAFYYKLKSLFKRHTIIYNYTARRCAELTGLSPATCAAYVRKLESKGLVTYHGSNLVVVAQNKVRANLNIKERTTLTEIDTTDKLNTIKDKLLLSYIYRLRDCQEYKASRVRELIKKHKTCKPKAYKAICQKIKESGIENAYAKPIFSSRSIANKLSMSQQSVQNLLLRLEKQKLISRRFLLQDVSYLRRSLDKNIKYPALRYRKGRLMLHHGFEITDNSRRSTAIVKRQDVEVHRNVDGTTYDISIFKW